jgi:hypothetical protein
MDANKVGTLEPRLTPEQAAKMLNVSTSYSSQSSLRSLARARASFRRVSQGRISLGRRLKWQRPTAQRTVC